MGRKRELRAAGERRCARRPGRARRAEESDMTYTTATIADLQGADGWAPIRKHFDVQSFGVNAWSTEEPGATLIPEHDEVPSSHEELYLVTAGHATSTVDGEEVDAPAGTLVYVADPALKRTAV